MRPDVTAVPAIELAYFDTASGAYKVARTQPIPLTIRATKVVTARDAEGRELAPAQAELKARLEGIAHNYEDLRVLASQHYGLATAAGDPLWLSFMGLPPLAYLALLIATTLVRRSRADPAAREAKRAYRELRRNLRALGRLPADDPSVPGAVLQAFRDYLGGKLHLSSAAITYGDVEPLLDQRGVAAEGLGALQRLFHHCEAGRYAGGAGAVEEPASLVEQALALAKALERSLR
jgi:hypothetical protein